MPTYTLTDVRRELSDKNPCGADRPSALGVLRRYLRNAHRRWWRVVGGVSKPPRLLRTWKAPAGWAERAVQGSPVDTIPSSDHWSPTRWEPSGAHPEDVRAVPHEYLGTVLDDSPEPKGWRPTARELSETHARDWSHCAACDERRDHILGGCDSSPTGRERSELQSSWTPHSYRKRDRAHRRRVERGARQVDRGDEMTKGEWSKYWTLRHKAHLCCSAVAILQRSLPAAGNRIERIAVPLRCRTRECLTCSVLASQHATVRMEAHWTQLVTLTLRQDRCSEAHAWRNVSRWVSKLMARLYAIGSRDSKRCDCLRGWCRKIHPEMILTGKKLMYAWVIEPHKKGWPHVHIAWDAKYVCFDLVREMWWEITGFAGSGSWVVKVGNPDRIPYYLAKYLTKGTFGTRLLAFMYRKRIWASNVPLKKKEETGYQLLEIRTEKGCEGLISKDRPPLVKDPSGWTAPERHWDFIDGADGKYSKWGISEQISDITLMAMQADAAQAHKERAEYSWNKALLRVKLKSRFNGGIDVSTPWKYLDSEGRALRGARECMERRDRDGGE